MVCAPVSMSALIVLVNLLPAGSRRRVITFSLLCGALFTSVVCGFRRLIRQPDVAHRPAVQRSRSADVDRLPCDPARLEPDVLPLSQVAWSFYRTGELPHHNAAEIDGVDVDVDALHPAAIAPPEAEKNEKGPLGWILILLPILIVAICFAHAGGTYRAAHGVRVAIVFALLLSLMLTGMPISIALGLTVLSFMFTLTDVRTESVA